MGAIQISRRSNMAKPVAALQGSCSSSGGGDFSAAGFPNWRYPVTTSAGRTIHSVEVLMHGNASRTAVVTVRTTAAVVVAVSSSVSIAAAAYVVFPFTPFTLPAGDYFIDIAISGGSGSPQLGNSTKTLVGIVSASGQALAAVAFPPATNALYAGTYGQFKLNGTP